MSRSRIFSKMIIPIALLTIYSITLYKTATTPVEQSLAEEQVVQTTTNLQSQAVEEENTNDIPRPPQVPPDSNTDSNNPEKLRFVALTDPKLVPATQATWLQPDDVILGIVHDGEAQAFPLTQMAFHHVVNVKVGGEPYLITYCELCDGFARSFKSEIDGIRYTFNIYGIYEDSLALNDRQTGSVWHQLDGKALSGPLESQKLSLQPHILTRATWKDWQGRYPETTVLPLYPDYLYQYAQIQLINQASASQEVTFPFMDSRLPADTSVLGTNVGNLFRAYPTEDFGNSLSVIHDSLDGTPIVIFFDDNLSIANIFEATLGDKILSFSIEDNEIVDSTGSIWDSSGRATKGALRGNQLSPVASLLTQWSSWAAYHPETSIYGQ